jgi:CheY-like chemotaxis protein
MKNVLLVEDEQSLGEVLAMILNGSGFRVTMAANGKRAIELLADAQPDLIITDYMMPMMNGVEMARIVRAKPEYAAVPILMLSGVPAEAIQRDAQMFNMYLRKPVDMDVLLGAITQLLPDWS